MRTWKEFSLDLQWARENVVAEAEGFKSAGKKRRKKKSEFLTAREKKIQKLKNKPSHWSGLV